MGFFEKKLNSFLKKAQFFSKSLIAASFLKNGSQIVGNMIKKQSSVLNAHVRLILSQVYFLNIAAER